MALHIPQDFNLGTGDVLGKEEFSALLDENFSKYKDLTGCVLHGTLVEIKNDHAVIDVGLKSEGVVPTSELPKDDFGELTFKVGDSLDVFVERFEDRDGVVQLSFERAVKEAAWIRLAETPAQQTVYGVIKARIRNGYQVELEDGHLMAFLHRNQLDVRPTDVEALLGTRQAFHIEKIDRTYNNIRVSRRSVIEKTRAETKPQLLKTLHVGKVLRGSVKNILEYGAFVDLGGIDGLLHITEIAWSKVDHPEQHLQRGQVVDVKVIRVNSTGDRISLSMRRLQPGPWEAEDFMDRYAKSAVVQGTVTKVADNGVFVQVEQGVEGFVQRRDLTWEKGGNFHPSQYVKEGQTVDVMVLDVNRGEYLMSLGIKQCAKNPFEIYAESHKVGDVVKGKVRSVTAMGLRMHLGTNLESMVEKGYLSWTLPGDIALKQYSSGQDVSLKILSIDTQNGRLLLSIKHTEYAPPAESLEKLSVGDAVACSVESIAPWGVSVKLSDGQLWGFIRKQHLPQDTQVEKGVSLDAKVIFINPQSGVVDLSAAALESEEQKRIIEQYRRPSSGATLGEILGLSETLGQHVRQKEPQSKDTTSEPTKKEVKTPQEDQKSVAQEGVKQDSLKESSEPEEAGAPKKKSPASGETKRKTTSKTKTEKAAQKEEAAE